jgi:Integrase zinc binding domain/RNase H-like domain found in reverse transcriptase
VKCTIENPGIRRFVWEHFQNLNRIVQRMKYAGGTFSGKKLVLCAEEVTVVGHVCTIEGRIADRSRVAAIKDWGPCQTLTEVRAFLGTIGVCRIFIKNFSHRAAPLTELTKKDAPFVFGPEQIAAQNELKKALLESPALRPIDYKSPAPVVLAVDTSYLAIGAHLCQCDEKDPKRRYYNRFESITLNDRERRFSQAKLEIYGLYRALSKLKMYLIGVRNFVVEVDAKYIKGMLRNPDIAPSASVNRWILGILTFHFQLVHVPGAKHGPDGLSRRPQQPDDEDVDYSIGTEEFEDWIDHLYGFVHIINDSPLAQLRTIRKRRIAKFPKKTVASVYTNSFIKPTDQISYDVVPRTPGARQEDEKLPAVIKFHDDLQRPDDMTDGEYTSFVRYCMRFFVDKLKLWRRHPLGAHKLVVPQGRRLQIMSDCHDDIGHKGYYPTRSIILERFWWPHMHEDIQWFVKSCHYCQERQIKQIKIPPVVATPAPIFAKAYIDTMHMSPSRGYKYIVQARCSLTHYPEYKALKKETAQTLGDWIFEDIICRWGALSEIVSDNGSAFVKALEHLSKKYKINYIRISGYNSRANGIVERPHFDVRQSLLKSVDGEERKWASALHQVFWAERVTVRRRLGVSPYFAVTGTHPLLPLDIIEATYLVPPPTSLLTTTDLIARRAIELQKRRQQVRQLFKKVLQARVDAARRFEKENKATIKNFDFKRGDLVLMRNTAIEKSLDRKMHQRYLGPYVVIDRNKGGAYLLCELDGSVFDRPVAAFRVIPYFARTAIELPEDALDASKARLKQLRESESQGDDDDDDDGQTDDADVQEGDEDSDGEDPDN